MIVLHPHDEVRSNPGSRDNQGTPVFGRTRVFPVAMDYHMKELNFFLKDQNIFIIKKVTAI